MKRFNAWTRRVILIGIVGGAITLNSGCRSTDFRDAINAGGTSYLKSTIEDILNILFPVADILQPDAAGE